MRIAGVYRRAPVVGAHVPGGVGGVEQRDTKVAGPGEAGDGLGLALRLLALFALAVRSVGEAAG